MKVLIYIAMHEYVKIFTSSLISLPYLGLFVSMSVSVPRSGLRAALFVDSMNSDAIFSLDESYVL